jgi:hypothetical protein
MRRSMKLRVPRKPSEARSRKSHFSTIAGATSGAASWTTEGTASAEERAQPLRVYESALRPEISAHSFDGLDRSLQVGAQGTLLTLWNAYSL